MHKRISKFFHIASKNHLLGHPPIPDNTYDWPEEWRTVHYKTYPRLPRIILPHVSPTADFFSLVAERSSKRDFHSIPVSMEDLSALLYYSCGEIQKETGRRAQPSGGGRYPIETYVLIFSAMDNGLSPGLYHYGVKDHALEVLWKRDFSHEDIGKLFTYQWVQTAGFALIYTAVFERNQCKYGERGYRYILIEAGHIGQNVYLASQALGLSCCALGGSFDLALEELLDIDGSGESVVYAMALDGSRK